MTDDRVNDTQTAEGHMEPESTTVEKTENALYVSSEVVANLPAMVRNELAKLSPKKQEEFLEEYQRKIASTAAAYLFFLIGGHYFYLRNWVLGIAYWVFFWVFCWFLIGFAWMIADIFRIPGLVRDYNKNVAIDTMRNLKAMSSN